MWVICCIFTWSILMVGGGMQQMVRFLIPKDLSTLRNALGYSVFFNIFILVTCSIVGLCGISLLPGLKATDNMVPLLIGIALLFLCERKLWGWLFIAVGFVIVIAAVIMSVSIRWRTSSGWMFFVMFALTIAGGAMMLRELFRGKE